MKISDLINISIKDFNKMTEEELTEALNYMNKTANARIDRLKKYGVGKDDKYRNNPAINILDRQGTEKFTLPRDTSFNEKRNLYMKVRQFLQAKTSTVTGHFEHRRDVIEDLKALNIDLKEENYDRFFDVYEKWKELHPDDIFKYNAMENINNSINAGLSDEEIIKDLERDYKQFYTVEQNIHLDDFYNFDNFDNFDNMENKYINVREKKQQERHQKTVQAKRKKLRQRKVLKKWGVKNVFGKSKK